MKSFKVRATTAMILTTLVFSLCATLNMGMARAADSVGTGEPKVEFTDFMNGTTLKVVDYQNGTQDTISETILATSDKMQVQEDSSFPTLSAALQTSEAPALSAERISTTCDLMAEQEVLMGFTYRLVAYRKLIDLNIIVAYARAGYDVDIGFGIRLPVRICLDYPRYMIGGHDYQVYAKLIPLDKPDFNETLLKFKAQFWVQAGVFNLLTLRWATYSGSWGPDYDWSRSFATPIGPDMRFPLPSVEVPLIDFWLLKLKAVVTPLLGSDKITANIKATGGASGESTLRWSTPNQIVPFTVHASNCAACWAEIELSDFRYYFSIFKLQFGLKFDFSSWIDWLTGDPMLTLFTLDMNWLTSGLYLGVHPGTLGTFKVAVRVAQDRYTYGVIDQVDIGDPCSELGHDLSGWGPTEMLGITSFRVAWHPCEGTSMYDRGGMVTLCGEECSIVRYVELRLLDGIADNSFDVYVQVSWGSGWTGWRKLYHYGEIAPSLCWVTHRICVPEDWKCAAKVRVAIVATGIPWSGFETHGQIAVDGVRLVGCISAPG